MACSPSQAQGQCDAPGAQFCFLIVRTFHKPVSFTVDDRNSVTVKIYSGQGGYDWGEVELRFVLELSPEQIDKLDKLLEAAVKIPDQDDGFGTDGSIWFLTVNKQGYHLQLGFWTPTAGTEQRQLSDFAALGL